MVLMLIVGGYLLFFTYTSWTHREYAKALSTVKLLFACLGVYLVVLLALSFTSKETIIGGGGDVRLCGLSLGCDLSASVIQVEKQKTFGNPPRELIAEGMCYLVTVKVTSNAPQPKLNPRELSGVVVDAGGRKYQRFLQAERELLSARGAGDPFERVAGPSGGSYKRVLVFDLPPNVQNPALIVHEGSWTERALELFLIGDEDSLFHKKTKFLLRPPDDL
jgi:hypothetical protein